MSESTALKKQTTGKTDVCPVFVRLTLPPGGLRLERGGILSEVVVAFETYGKLNAARDNAILLCHALTGSSHAADLPNTAAQNFPQLPRITVPERSHLLSRITHYPGWWNEAIGPGKALDTTRYCVIVPNILGSCYGTTGPLTANPDTGEPYRIQFPPVTVRDMVTVQALLVQQLGIPRLAAVVGGSLGGMQVLEWAAMFPDMVERIIPIATSAAHSPWAIALNEIARQAIFTDPAWQNGFYREQPRQGMALARMAAMISYRSFPSFLQKFQRDVVSTQQAFPGVTETPQFQVESYLHYQGQKFYQRFDANSYLFLTRAMDWHDVGQGRGGVETVLASITQPALVVGIDSDVLYPVAEQKYLATHLPNSTYAEITSLHGHDAFLIEWDQVNGLIRQFLSDS